MLKIDIHRFMSQGEISAETMQEKLKKAGIKYKVSDVKVQMDMLTPGILTRRTSQSSNGNGVLYRLTEKGRNEQLIMAKKVAQQVVKTHERSSKRKR